MQAHILCLEPFGGGSHAAFWQGWTRHSRHHLEVLDLPAVHWKWRSRHASLSLALAANQAEKEGRRFDVMVCSDMLNLPEWRGLVAQELRSLPCIAYFHENQFTYPLSEGTRRDFHFGYSNVLTAIAADEVWFNSTFHRDEFSSAASQWLRRMPDYKHLGLFETAIANSKVLPPGIEAERIERGGSEKRALRKAGCQHAHESPVLGWVARWEYDKRPDLFADAVEHLVDHELDFELILLGQQFALQNDALRRLQSVAAGRIRHLGYAKSREEYWQLLHEIDVVVSTADHDFFGLGIVEAVAAGAIPLLPNRLAYPEVFGLANHPERKGLFYDNAQDLANKLIQRLSDLPKPNLRSERMVEHFYWHNLVEQYDAAIDRFI